MIKITNIIRGTYYGLLIVVAIGLAMIMGAV